MNEKTNKKINWTGVLIEFLFAAMILFGLLAVGFAYKSNLLEKELDNGFVCLNAIKVDCNTTGSYHCGMLNEPCCHFHNPSNNVDKNNCAFCMQWEFNKLSEGLKNEIQG